jgi:sporulation protein YlmC with PRC-barrel domain
MKWGMNFLKCGILVPIRFKNLTPTGMIFTLTYVPLQTNFMETKIGDTDNLYERDNLTGKNQGALLPNQRGRYLTASSVIGDKVVNSAEEHLGEIQDIMLDMENGKIDYIIIEFGGFLGMGVKYFAIPFRLLHLDAPNKRFVFNQSREKLENAPGFDMDHWPDTNLHFDEVHSYWRFI